MSLRTPKNLRKLQRKLYVKADDEPEFRFYSLIDKAYRADTLWHAWQLVRRNGGQPGADGVRISDIVEMGEVEWLEALQTELRQEEYAPSPTLRVMILKPSGGSRPLGIPTVKDRVVQTAVKLVIEPIFEADFEDNAFGYRPERSAQQAVEVVHEELLDGRRDVVDADLSSYFDTIPHDQLMRSVRQRISDGRILALIKRWLEVPTIERDDDGTERTLAAGSEGTPQGGVISPVLANIYINRFLKFWREQNLDEALDARVINYADDFVIVTRGRADEALRVTKRVMESMGLALNEQKTKIRDVDKEPLDFLGYTFCWDHYRPTGRRYLSAQPAKSRIKRMKQKIRAWFEKALVRPWDQIVRRINQMLEGWGNYFSYGTCERAYRAIDQYTCERARKALRRRHGHGSRGRGRWPYEWLYGSAGGLRHIKDFSSTAG